MNFLTVNYIYYIYTIYIIVLYFKRKLLFITMICDLGSVRMYFIKIEQTNLKQQQRVIFIIVFNN